MTHDDGTGLDDRVITSWSRRKALDRRARSILLSASEDLTVCCLLSLSRVRESRDPQAKLFTENRKLRIENARLQDENRLLRGRLQTIPARQRPHYSPAARFDILAHMKTFLLTVEQAARRFLVTAQTLYNWLAELKDKPDVETIGSLLKPEPPVRRYHDVVRRLTRQMKAFKCGGHRQIAATLAYIGWKPSRRSVGRFCREDGSGASAPPPTMAPSPTPRLTTVRGRYPRHLGLIDITSVPTIFPFVKLHLAVVLDAFSRMPLAAAVSILEPTAAAMVALVQRAAARHGAFKHLVTDQGHQFTAELFRHAVTALGTRQRFGAVGQTHSLGLIDRFFRTVKFDLHQRLILPWNRRDFERWLHAALVRYAYLRPHASLVGRVPAELYFGLADQRPFLNYAPRDGQRSRGRTVPSRSRCSTSKAPACLY
jgi:transposase InsO family protein